MRILKTILTIFSISCIVACGEDSSNLDEGELDACAGTCLGEPEPSDNNGGEQSRHYQCKVDVPSLGHEVSCYGEIEGGLGQGRVGQWDCSCQENVGELISGEAVDCKEAIRTLCGISRAETYACIGLDFSSVDREVIRRCEPVEDSQTSWQCSCKDEQVFLPEGSTNSCNFALQLACDDAAPEPGVPCTRDNDNGVCQCEYQGSSSWDCLQYCDNKANNGGVGNNGGAIDNYITATSCEQALDFGCAPETCE